MISFREMSLGVYGAWRLLWRDPRAMAFFECTVDGAIRSFWAAALCYPGFLVLLLFQQGEGGDLYRVLLVQSIGYVIGWCAYPLAALPFCRWLASEERALGFIIAYNWSQVLQTAVLLPVAALGAWHVAPDYAVAYVNLVAYLAILVYEWFIARIALAAGGGAATALVLLDVVLGALLAQITNALSGQ